MTDARPLYVQLAALAALEGRSATSSTTALDEVIDIEDHHRWRRHHCPEVLAVQTEAVTSQRRQLVTLPGLFPVADRNAARHVVAPSEPTTPTESSTG